MTKPAPKWRVLPVTLKDIGEILSAGIRDFAAAPVYGLFFGGIYVLGGWLLLSLLFYLHMPYFFYPLAMGFALIAPFAVVALYSVSANLEAGRPNTWASVFGAIKDSFNRDVRWMALVTGFSLVIWMDIAAFLLFAFVGINGFNEDFITTILTTPSGWLFLLVGNATGAMLALAVFSISVISFPMLYDKDIDFVTAMTTSVQLVLANPKAMLVWCAIIGILVGISLLSMFLGLFVVLPILGHATWHLYRRAVAPAEAIAGAAA